MKDRFEFESEIMSCWNIIDDLKLICDNWESLSEDKKLNALIGMVTLYDMKFETMFSTFEDLIRTGQCT